MMGKKEKGIGYWSKLQTDRETEREGGCEMGESDQNTLFSCANTNCSEYRMGLYPNENYERAVARTNTHTHAHVRNRFSFLSFRC